MDRKCKISEQILTLTGVVSLTCVCVFYEEKRCNLCGILLPPPSFCPMEKGVQKNGNKNLQCVLIIRSRVILLHRTLFSFSSPFIYH